MAGVAVIFGVTHQVAVGVGGTRVEVCVDTGFFVGDSGSLEVDMLVEDWQAVRIETITM